MKQDQFKCVDFKWDFVFKLFVEFFFFFYKFDVIECV